MVLGSCLRIMYNTRIAGVWRIVIFHYKLGFLQIVSMLPCTTSHNFGYYFHVLIIIIINIIYILSVYFKLLLLLSVLYIRSLKMSGKSKT